MLKLDMQVDFPIYSGISVKEEGSVFVNYGGVPGGVADNPTLDRKEIPGFDDKLPAGRKADRVNFRGDNLPSPPASRQDGHDSDHPDV